MYIRYLHFDVHTLLFCELLHYVRVNKIKGLICCKLNMNIYEY